MNEISIIIPVYNKEKYLSTVLSQILLQDFSDFECILVDDGSKDGSSEICDKYAAADGRIKVIHKANGGVSAARNDGIAIARGKYITFIDGDDEILPNHLSSMHRCMTESDADMVIGGCIKFWDGSNKKQEISVPYTGETKIDAVFNEFAEKQYANGIYGICCNKLIKSEHIKDLSFKNGLKLAEDLELYLSVYPKLKSIYFNPEQTYLYRQEADNSSMQGKDDSIDYFSQLLIHFKMYDMLKDAGYLNETNNDLVVKRIYDYVYFSLFYAPKKQIAEMCLKISMLNLPVRIRKNDGKFLKRTILDKYEKGSYNSVSFIIKIYRLLKKAKGLFHIGK